MWRWWQRHTFRWGLWCWAVLFPSLAYVELGAEKPVLPLPLVVAVEEAHLLLGSWVQSALCQEVFQPPRLVIGWGEEATPASQKLLLVASGFLQ